MCLNIYLFILWPVWVLIAVCGFSLAPACGLLIVVAPSAAEHGPQGAWASLLGAHGLSSCRFWAQEQ